MDGLHARRTSLPLVISLTRGDGHHRKVTPFRAVAIDLRHISDTLGRRWPCVLVMEHRRTVLLLWRGGSLEIAP